MFPIGFFGFKRSQAEVEVKKEDFDIEIINNSEDMSSISDWSELSCPESDSDGYELITNVRNDDLKDILQREPLVKQIDDVTIIDNDITIVSKMKLTKFVYCDVKHDVTAIETEVTRIESDVIDDVSKQYDDVIKTDDGVTQGTESDVIGDVTMNCDYVTKTGDVIRKRYNRSDVSDDVIKFSNDVTGDEKGEIAQELLKGRVLQKLSDLNRKHLAKDCKAMTVWKKTARKGLQLSLTKLVILALQFIVILFSIAFTCAHEMSERDLADVPLRSCDHLLSSRAILGSCDQVLGLNSGKYRPLNEIGIPELFRRSVHIKDREYVTSVITDLIQAGDNKLQVVADFDFTLSCFNREGEPCVSCHKALDDSPLLPDDYRNQAHALRSHYYPLEIDPQLTKEEKFPLMEEWWNKSHQLLIDYKLSRHDIEEIVQDSKLYLRQGCSEAFEVLHKHGIPLMIFSAGLGDIIYEAVNQQATMFDNMKIVANMMTFDNKGLIIGFKGKNIHSLNKNESALSHADGYFQKLAHRDRLILLGDNLGDLHMADGAEHIKTRLTIGFLNDKIEERLEQYKNAYDIVIVNDETVDVPNAILRAIFK